MSMTIPGLLLSPRMVFPKVPNYNLYPSIFNVLHPYMPTYFIPPQRAFLFHNRRNV